MTTRLQCELVSYLCRSFTPLFCVPRNCRALLSFLVEQYSHTGRTTASCSCAHARRCTTSLMSSAGQSSWTFCRWVTKLPVLSLEERIKSVQKCKKSVHRNTFESLGIVLSTQGLFVQVKVSMHLHSTIAHVHYTLLGHPSKARSLFFDQRCCIPAFWQHFSLFRDPPSRKGK